MHIRIYKEVLIKEHDILKKPYLAPRISFEEIEEDEREMLMAGSNNDAGGSGTSGGDTGDNEMSSMDVIFEEPSSDLLSTQSDFIINDEY